MALNEIIEISVGRSRHRGRRKVSVLKVTNGSSESVASNGWGKFQIRMPVDSIQIADHLSNQPPTHWEIYPVEIAKGDIILVGGSPVKRKLLSEAHPVASRRVKFTLASKS